MNLLYCWCHSDSASVLLYFTKKIHFIIHRDLNVKVYSKRFPTMCIDEVEQRMVNDKKIQIVYYCLLCNS